MMLDGKKGVHLDGSSIGQSAGLKWLRDRRVAACARKLSRRGLLPRVYCPGPQVSEVARKHGSTRWQIYDWRRRFYRGARCRRANLRQRASRGWWWKSR